MGWRSPLVVVSIPGLCQCRDAHHSRIDHAISGVSRCRTAPSIGAKRGADLRERGNECRLQVGLAVQQPRKLRSVRAGGYLLDLAIELALLPADGRRSGQALAKEGRGVEAALAGDLPATVRQPSQTALWLVAEIRRQEAKRSRLVVRSADGQNWWRQGAQCPARAGSGICPAQRSSGDRRYARRSKIRLPISRNRHRRLQNYRNQRHRRNSRQHGSRNRVRPLIYRQRRNGSRYSSRERNISGAT